MDLETPSDMGMKAMSVESGVESSPRDARWYLRNRAFGNMRYIIGGLLLLTMIVCVWVFNPTSTNKETAVARTMSWPPPEVQDFVSLENLDRNRGRILLGSPDDLVTGATILQKVNLRTYEEINEVNVNSVVNVENKMLATDLSKGGKKIDVTLTRYYSLMSVSSNGEVLNRIEYDSNEPNNNEDPDMEAVAGIIGPMIGQTNTIEVDEAGNVVHASENEELLKAFSGENGKMLSAGDQFQQMNSMADVLPDGPVEPGDDWNFEMKMEEMYGGSAVLLGYMNYDNSDCAVIKLDGILEISSDQLDAIGNAVGDYADDDEVKSQLENIYDGMDLSNGKMSVIMYWDHKYNIARFSHATFQFDLTMNDPSDPMMKITVPVNETVTSYSSIKE